MRVTLLVLTTAISMGQDRPVQGPVQGWLGAADGARALIAGPGTLLAGSAPAAAGKLLGATSSAIAVDHDGALHVVNTATNDITPAPPHARLIAAVDRDTLVMLAGERTLWMWRAGEVTRPILPADGDIVAVTEGAVVLREGERAWIVHRSGARQPLEPGIDAAVLWHDKAVLYRRGARLIFRAPSGEEQEIAVSLRPHADLVWMGENWVRAGEHHAIRRTEARCEAFLLPGVSP